MQTGAPFTAQGKALAQRIEAMWQSLATEFRAWDLLEPVVRATRGERERALGRLYDLWVSTRYNPTEMRRLLSDIDLEPMVERWYTIHRRGVGEGYAIHTIYHVRYLFPEGVPCPVSRITTAWLTERLASYPGARNTLRRVHSAWSLFFEYLTSVQGLFAANPMHAVSRPAEYKAPVEFYELSEVKRIVEAQPTEGRRALFAILYGAGIEVSTTLGLTRADVWDASREIRAAGTKTHTRDRVGVVADWAWPIIAAYVKRMLPSARLFPAEWKVYQVNHWHRWCVREQLKLGKRLKVHAARNHWAVMRLRAGVPIAVVQRQLGHSTPMLTLTVYGQFIPTGEDRAHWEKQVTKAESKRLSALGGAQGRHHQRGSA
jgi:site-specific recombinase XerD